MRTCWWRNLEQNFATTLPASYRIEVSDRDRNFYIHMFPFSEVAVSVNGSIPATFSIIFGTLLSAIHLILAQSLIIERDGNGRTHLDEKNSNGFTPPLAVSVYTCPLKTWPGRWGNIKSIRKVKLLINRWTIS